MNRSGEDCHAVRPEDRAREPVRDGHQDESAENDPEKTVCDAQISAPAATGLCLGQITGSQHASVPHKQWKADLRAFTSHLSRDGAWIAMLYLVRLTLHRMHPRTNRLLAHFRPRDAGERAAERFLRALGYQTLARNWRSFRDPRDEADLVMLSPDRATVVVVEVKRARGPWDALDRVDARKREVLWRLLQDLTDSPGFLKSGRAESDTSCDERRPLVGRRDRSQSPSPKPSRSVVHPSRPLKMPASADLVRVDLIGVRGEGRSASAVRHVVGLFERRLHRSTDSILRRSSARSVRSVSGASHVHAADGHHSSREDSSRTEATSQHLDDGIARGVRGARDDPPARDSPQANQRQYRSSAISTRRRSISPISSVTQRLRSESRYRCRSIARRRPSSSARNCNCTSRSNNERLGGRSNARMPSQTTSSRCSSGALGTSIPRPVNRSFVASVKGIPAMPSGG